MPGNVISEQVLVEVDQILSSLKKVVGRLSGDSLRTNQLAALLTGAGYRQSSPLPLVEAWLSLAETFMILVAQAATKNQLGHPKTQRVFTCSSLVLNGIKIGGFHALLP